MVAFTFARLAIAASALLFVGSVAAAPALDTRAKPKAAAAAAPHFVIYGDQWISTGLPSVDQVKGYNVFALSFWLTTGPADNALGWAQLTADQRTALKATYAEAGIKVIVSAFGSTDTPTSAGKDATQVANDLAAYVKANNLDGVDVDYEDLNAFNAGDGSAEKWLSTFTTALRAALPAGDFIITHAPLAPWFQPGSRWGGGGYLAVDKNVGALVDWYNVQFYNQGASVYTTCDGLLTSSDAAWPQTSLFEIAASGVDQNKLVIGKPATAADATNGFLDSATLAGCVSTAKGKGWNGGVMVWQFPNANAQWISTVRGGAFPLTSTPTPTTKPPSVTVPKFDSSASAAVKVPN